MGPRPRQVSRLKEVPQDFDGQKRKHAPDIGADEVLPPRAAK